MRKGYINFKIIFRVLGSLLFIESFFLIISLIVFLIYNETNSSEFLITIGIALSLGIISRIFTGNTKKEFTKREGFIIVNAAAAILLFTINFRRFMTEVLLWIEMDFILNSYFHLGWCKKYQISWIIHFSHR